MKTGSLRITRYLVMLPILACHTVLAQTAKIEHAANPVPINDIAWETEFPKEMFPAIILSVGGSRTNSEQSGILCDPRSAFRIHVKSPTPATKIHVEVRIDGFSESSPCDAVLQETNQSYIIAPTPRWDMRKLAFTDQPYPTTVTVNLTANGVSLGERTERLEIRAVNDVPTRIVDKDGQVGYRFKLFAAFVNENNPVIDELLHEALEWRSVPSFVGYQRKTPESVRLQVFAIWNALQHRHVKYSSITTASGFSANVQSQSVRFVDQTVRLSEANCVDGSVLIASALYKIGVLPVLTGPPGHMFLGYYLDPKSDGTVHDIEFLETTMIGNVDIPNQRFNKTIEDSPSYKNFMAALNKGDQEFRQNVLPGLRERNPQYKFISVRKARENGITAIPR